MVRLTLDLGSESIDFPGSTMYQGLAERPVRSFTRRPKRVDGSLTLTSPGPGKISRAHPVLTTEGDVLILVPRQCFVELVK